MRLGKGWIVVAAIAALLVAGFAGNALAHSPIDAADGGGTYSWEEMHALCHGAEGGEGGMMGEAAAGMGGGYGGMMGGSGGGMGWGGGMMGGW